MAKTDGDDYFDFLLAFYVLKTNLGAWIGALESKHDHKKSEVVHEDDYQNGYLHGMMAAIAYLKDEMDGVKDREQWIRDNND